MALLMAVARSEPRPKPNVACRLHARCAAPAGAALESKTAASRAKPPILVTELIIVHTRAEKCARPTDGRPTAVAFCLRRSVPSGATSSRRRARRKFRFSRTDALRGLSDRGGRTPLTSNVTARKLPARQLVTATRVKENILLPPHQGLATHPILAQHLRH